MKCFDAARIPYCAEKLPRPHFSQSFRKEIGAAGKFRTEAVTIGKKFATFLK